MAEQRCITKTQETLGKLTSNPTLQERYLKTPPFGVLHETVMELVRLTHFARGLYTAEECDAAQLLDEEAKVDFLNKAIDVTAFALGEKIDVSAKEAIAGLEAGKTKAWLQKLHQAATTCASAESDEAVQRVLNGETMSAPKENKMKEEDGPPQEASPVEESMSSSLRGAAMAGPFEDQAPAEPLSMGFLQARGQQALEDAGGDVDLTVHTMVGGGTAEPPDEVTDSSTNGPLRRLFAALRSVRCGRRAARQNPASVVPISEAAEALRLQLEALAAENENLATKLAASEVEERELAAKLTAAEQEGPEPLITSLKPAEEDATILRNIYYGKNGTRGLSVYGEIVITHQDGQLDEQDAAAKWKGRLTFGERVKLVEEKKVESGPTWFHVRSLATEVQGWVVGEIPGKLINCVNMESHRQKEGRIPEDAYLGQDFPHVGLYTEGYAGKHNTCIISASGDNFWRELNIELLFRDIGTATVFEQEWGGDEHFTDWVAFYAFNCALYGEIGSNTPKHLIVTVKPTADYTTYPRSAVVPKDVHNNIGRAQLKECEWLESNVPKKGFPWDSVEFMTTFQFLKSRCKWTQEDCKAVAADKAQRVLRKGVFQALDPSSMTYQLQMVQGSLTEAFGSEVFPDDIRERVHEMETYKDRAKSLMEKLQEVGEDCCKECCDSAPQEYAGVTWVSFLQDRGAQEKIHLAALPLQQEGLTGTLQALLEDRREWKVWQGVSQAIGHPGDQAVSEALLPAVRDREMEVRAQATLVLCRFGCPGWQAAFRDGDLLVQIAVAGGVRNFGGRAAVPALLAALQQGSHENARMHAAAALGELGEEAAVPALQAALRDGNETVRTTAAEALTVRTTAAEALTTLGDRAGLPVYLAIQLSAEGPLNTAAEALVKLGDRAAVPALQAAVRNKDFCSLLRISARAMGTLGDRAAVPMLLQILQNRYGDVRAAAAEALGKLGDRAAVPALLAASQDSEEKVRSAAGAALAELRASARTPSVGTWMIHRALPEGSSTFRVQVPKPYPGVQYRKSKNLNDRYLRYAEQGTVVAGQVEDNGEWLRINDQVFLPMKVGGLQVLRAVLELSPTDTLSSPKVESGRTLRSLWFACSQGTHGEEQEVVTDFTGAN